MIGELALQMGASRFAAARLESAYAVGHLACLQALSCAVCPDGDEIDGRDVIRSGRAAYRAAFSGGSPLREMAVVLALGVLGVTGLAVGLVRFSPDLFHIAAIAFGIVVSAASMLLIGGNLLHGGVQFADAGAIRDLSAQGLYWDSEAVWATVADGGGPPHVRKVYLDALGDVVLLRDGEGCESLVLNSREGTVLFSIREPKDGHGGRADEIREAIEAARVNAVRGRL